MESGADSIMRHTNQDLARTQDMPEQTKPDHCNVALHFKPKRYRRSYSCSNCHTRRIKCDRVFPCGQCTLRGQVSSCVKQNETISASSAAPTPSLLLPSLSSSSSSASSSSSSWSAAAAAAALIEDSHARMSISTTASEQHPVPSLSRSRTSSRDDKGPFWKDLRQDQPAWGLDGLQETMDLFKAQLEEAQKTLRPVRPCHTRRRQSHSSVRTKIPGAKCKAAIVEDRSASYEGDDHNYDHLLTLLASLDLKVDMIIHLHRSLPLMLSLSRQKEKCELIGTQPIQTTPTPPTDFPFHFDLDNLQLKANFEGEPGKTTFDSLPGGSNELPSAPPEAQPTAFTSAKAPLSWVDGSQCSAANDFFLSTAF